MKFDENSSWRKFVTRYVPLIVWLGVIFYSSTGNASMAKTSGFLRPLLERIFSSEETIYWANVVIRKIAHLSYYAILAFLAARAFLVTQRKFVKVNFLMLAFALVFVIAGIDEIHQSFVPSRVGSFSDVLLDCIGGGSVLLIVKIFQSFKRTVDV